MSTYVLLLVEHHVHVHLEVHALVRLVRLEHQPLVGPYAISSLCSRQLLRRHMNVLSALGHARLSVDGLHLHMLLLAAPLPRQQFFLN